MKIYEISGAISGQWYWHYAATKLEAKAHIKQVKEEYVGCLVELEFTPMDVNSGRAGVVEALNWFIQRTCLNE